MKHYKIVITLTAELEISECLDFIAEDSVVNALSWYGTVYEKLQTLETMSERCPIADESSFFGV